MAGMLAKTAADKAKAMADGEQRREHSMGDRRACDVVNDLVRLVGQV
jgi:hypothetical protein